MAYTGHYKRGFALKCNLTTLLEHSKQPGFLTVTFWTQQHYVLMMKAWATFSRRLVEDYGIFGLRVNEWGKKNEQFHIHAGLSKFLHPDQVERAAWGTLIGFHNCQVVYSPKGFANYLRKEFTKQFRDALPASRQWATFGRYPEGQQTQLRDVVVESNITDCFREAWGVREPGDRSESVTMAAMAMHLDWLKGGENDEYEYDERCGIREDGNASARCPVGADSFHFQEDEGAGDLEACGSQL